MTDTGKVDRDYLDLALKRPNPTLGTDAFRLAALPEGLNRQLRFRAEDDVMASYIGQVLGHLQRLDRDRRAEIAELKREVTSLKRQIAAMGRKPVAVKSAKVVPITMRRVAR